MDFFINVPEGKHLHIWQHRWKFLLLHGKKKLALQKALLLWCVSPSNVPLESWVAWWPCHRDCSHEQPVWVNHWWEGRALLVQHWFTYRSRHEQNHDCYVNICTLSSLIGQTFPSLIADPRLYAPISLWNVEAGRRWVYMFCYLLSGSPETISLD